MATKPEPVPWPDVVDLVDELFDWLVASGHAAKKDDPLTAVWRILGTLGTDDSLPSRVAQAIHDLELYRGAGRREDELTRTMGSTFTESVRELLFDDSIEREADRDIRGLFPRFQKIRRLFIEIAERKERRDALLPLAPAFVEAGASRRQVELDIVLVRLNVVMDATNQLYEDFEKFNPAATEYPLTLSGWREFEKQVRTDLGALGFVWAE